MVTGKLSQSLYHFLQGFKTAINTQPRTRRHTNALSQNYILSEERAPPGESGTSSQGATIPDVGKQEHGDGTGDKMKMVGAMLLLLSCGNRCRC